MILGFMLTIFCLMPSAPMLHGFVMIDMPTSIEMIELRCAGEA